MSTGADGSASTRNPGRSFNRMVFADVSRCGARHRCGANVPWRLLTRNPYLTPESIRTERDMPNVVGERFQITIDKRVREELGIKPGDRAIERV